jgi:hypothetical protein
MPDVLVAAGSPRPVCRSRQFSKKELGKFDVQKA